MKKNIFTKVLAFLLVGTALTSCLKDDNIDAQKYGMINLNTNKIVEVSGSKAFGVAFEDKVADLAIVTVHLAAEAPAAEDIKVTLSLDKSAEMIAAYNAANGTEVVQLPTNLYTQPASGLTLTIPKGSNSVSYNIQVNGKSLGLTSTYALGLTIASVDKPGYVISGNFGKALIRISAKNKYDGVYTVTGTMVDATNATLGHLNKFLFASGPSVGLTTDPMEFELRTISPTKCEVYDNYFFGGNYAPISSGTTYSQYGSFSAIVEFDPATDKIVGVTNFYGQPAANTRSGRLDPTGVNTYKNGTITIKYNMLQPSVVTVAPHVRSTWDEVWKFKKSR